ncbi:hypothetical protein PC113_g4964 [Phytophthora cactorum]|uniref:DDE-1 domain-containing protein n=1 Tax=Phytophthora cactorum TaxID=29920 RepID=A0A8T0ZPJ1_9STRA|nr:hypothetical protein PC112_g5276 [Phytophthora cactorum]KAG2863966.1 hypothetical protein PC113_g4964 [Phytophthora cactorum]KAG3184680.1 hypothetical protein C6341_g4832 [Phytophthora cactorum]
MQCFSALDVVHTTQRKAWCDHATMMKWIEEVWTPTADGCRMLMLDSLRVHKMESLADGRERHALIREQHTGSVSRMAQGPRAL